MAEGVAEQARQLETRWAAGAWLPEGMRAVQLTIERLLRPRRRLITPQEARSLERARSAGLDRSEAGQAASPPGPNGQARVLVVEDDPDARDVLVLLLATAGLTVETARNGNEALERVRTGPPAVIVADVRTDGMSGFELCRILREMGVGIPFIFCSALTAANERVFGLRVGADDYLVKPYVPEELLIKVQRWVQRKPAAPASPPPREVRKPAPRVAETPRPVEAGPKRRILIVDDDAESAAAFRQHLLRGGYEVRIVGSGNEALDLLVRSEPPDLVILDVVMPILSGLDVCRWIRRNPSTRALPVILLSGRNGRSDILEGEKAGCDLYVPKSVPGRRLVNLLGMFLSRDGPLQKKLAVEPPPQPR